MTPIIIIPARLASSRLPHKPLALIEGKTMLEHVWARAVNSAVGPVVIACCGRDVADVVQSFGGIAIVTDPSLPSGSDRIYAALEQFDPQQKYDTVLNVQGDLPLLDPHFIEKLVLLLKEAPEAALSTLAAPIRHREELEKPQVVKPIITFDKEGGDEGYALYFTRAIAPYGEGPHYHHIGLYGYRRETLRTFVGLKPSPLEKRESLEQLRALENGMKIRIGIVDEAPVGVDTEEDLEHVRAVLKR